MPSLDRIVSNIKDCKERKLALDFPEAAVLLPLTDRPNDPEIVFTKRATHLDKHSGQVAFPGGKKDPEDASLYETALREAHEEIGLCPSLVTKVGELDQVISKYEILVSPFVGIVPTDVKLTANPDEIDSIFKVPVSFFLNTKPARIDKLGFKGHFLNVPSYHYQGYDIWGMSAIVLVNFLNVGLQAGMSLRSE